MTIFVKQNILWLQIAIDDTERVEVTQSQADLSHINAWEKFNELAREIDHLLKGKPKPTRNFLGEATLALEVEKELSTLIVVENKVELFLHVPSMSQARAGGRKQQVNTPWIGKHIAASSRKDA